MALRLLDRIAYYALQRLATPIRLAIAFSRVFSLSLKLSRADKKSVRFSDCRILAKAEARRKNIRHGQTRSCRQVDRAIGRGSRVGAFEPSLLLLSALIIFHYCEPPRPAIVSCSGSPAPGTFGPRSLANLGFVVDASIARSSLRSASTALPLLRWPDFAERRETTRELPFLRLPCV